MIFVSGLLVTLLLADTNGFIQTSLRKVSPPLFASTSGGVDGSKTWQEDLDSVLNIDTSCDSRKDSVRELLKKSNVVLSDVVDAVKDKDVSKLAPPTLGYGKAVKGLQAVRRQIISDLIPDFLFNEGPKLIQDAPKRINEIVSDGPKAISGLISRGQDLLERAREISQDPSLLQSTLDEAKREAKNILRTTPEGIQTPDYTVLKLTDNYEIRKYSSYSVCSTELSTDPDQSMMSPLSTGSGFNKLADYIFGNNNKDSTSETLSMTTPVIIASGSMEFVLPSGMSSINAPLPATPDISVKDILAEIIAVKEFPGIATDGEVMRQRAFLEDALLADGITFDNLSFRVLQYNPPYTLPWLRRNEVTLRVSYTEPPIEEFVSRDDSDFLSSPEAGD